MPEKKIFLYFLFAVLSSFINLIGQHIFLNFYESLFLAVIAGSSAGLVFKYALDSFFVFESNRDIDLRTFIKYAFIGACITPVIWVVEVTFLNIFGTVFMRDVGALIGIALAYYIKYEMDKRFVFT
tara:strand:+ start:598 stop:975 length:378 start_codon:yes stop_codon:yes gene_type:complete